MKEKEYNKQIIPVSITVEQGEITIQEKANQNRKLKFGFLLITEDTEKNEQTLGQKPKTLNLKHMWATGSRCCGAELRME